MRKLFALLLVLTLLPVLPASARQQSLAYAELHPADLSAFPETSTLLDVFDSRGVFISGLKPEEVTIYEDGSPLPVDSLNERLSPLELVVAVNQGPSLDVRDSNNFSRFQRASQIITQWAQTRPADSPDDYSLVSQAGPVINHANAADFAVGLNGFNPDFRASTPNLLSLSIALDTVSAQTPQPGMKRAVLFITPNMTDFNLAADLETHLNRARENNIRVFVWFVDFSAVFQSPGAAAFNNLAAQTGGSMFSYSGIERFPDPEAYFAALRRVYSLTYTSRIKTSGDHSLSARVNSFAGTFDAPPQTFNINVQPPNPFALTNDLQIVRRAEETTFDTGELLPKSQEIKIIIEFPDGHPRPLTRTTLYVDGAIMDENTVEPFDVFTWDISAYTKTAEHQVMVEAVDVLGLQQASMPVPVNVTVVQPLQGGLGLLARYRIPLTFGAIILAGLALFLILISGRLRMPSIRAAQEARRAEADPLTQSIRPANNADASSPTIPIASAKTKNGKSKAAAKKTTAQEKPQKKEADAMFIRINPDGQPAPTAPILILDAEITFGMDPIQCTQIIDDPSVSPLHARLRETEDGAYLLVDNNSTAGTWVNYTLIPREGIRILHGDMIHFGKLSYRFTLKNPPENPKPKITSVEE